MPLLLRFLLCGSLGRFSHFCEGCINCNMILIYDLTGIELETMKSSQEYMIKETSKGELIRGFIFACTEKTEAECFERLLFGTDRVYGPIVIRIRKGDLLFLNNLDTNALYGIFKAVSNGDLNIQPDAWNGKYLYNVKVELLGKKIELKNSKKILKKFKIKRNTPLLGKKIDWFPRSFYVPTNPV